MKKYINSKTIGIGALFFMMFTLFIMNSCSKDEAGWADARYLSNYELSWDNPNPKTGQPYTEEELAELKYDPSKEERFNVGDPVNLSLLLSKEIKDIKVIDGVDGTTLKTINSSEKEGDRYRVNIQTTLEELKIAEGASKIVKFDIVYQDESIGSIEFKISSVVPLPPMSQSLVGRWQFDDATDLTKATLGNDLTLGGGMEQTATAGISGGDGAVLTAFGSYYEVDHGLPAAGGAKRNVYSLIFDVNLPASSFGTYSGLLQTLTDNSGDGSTYINPGGGLWANGIGSTGDGAITPDTWHRIVITVGDGDYRAYVDGIKIIGGSPGPDGIHALDLSKFIVFADNGGEDAPIKVTDMMLFDITFTNEQVTEELTGVGEEVK